MLKRLIASAAVALALASPAMAQSQADQKAQSREDTASRDLSTMSEKDIKGATIRNQAGDQIGTVDHVVIDKNSAKVKYVVVGVGGFLGMGAKDVAVPWDKMQAGDRPQTFVLNTDKETLKNAPTVDMSNLQALDQPQTQQQISSYWSQAAHQQAQTPKKGQMDKEKGR